MFEVEHFGIICFWVMLRTNTQTRRYNHTCSSVPTPTDIVAVTPVLLVHKKLGLKNLFLAVFGKIQKSKEQNKMDIDLPPHCVHRKVWNSRILKILKKLRHVHAVLYAQTENYSRQQTCTCTLWTQLSCWRTVSVSGRTYVWTVTDLFKWHTACKQFDHVSCSHNDVRIKCLPRRTHLHAASDNIKLCFHTLAVT